MLNIDLLAWYSVAEWLDTRQALWPVIACTALAALAAALIFASLLAYRLAQLEAAWQRRVARGLA